MLTELETTRVCVVCERLHARWERGGVCLDDTRRVAGLGPAVVDSNVHVPASSERVGEVPLG
jgi:hypothetical protein